MIHQMSRLVEHQAEIEIEIPVVFQSPESRISSLLLGAAIDCNGYERADSSISSRFVSQFPFGFLWTIICFPECAAGC
jgi:hypothetical protein